MAEYALQLPLTAEDVENDSDDKISLREAILYAAQDAAAVKNGTLAESALAVNASPLSPSAAATSSLTVDILSLS